MLLVQNKCWYWRCEGSAVLKKRRGSLEGVQSCQPVRVIYIDMWSHSFGKSSQTLTWMWLKTGRKPQRQQGRLTERRTKKPSDTYEQTDRQIDRQANRQAGRKWNVSRPSNRLIYQRDRKTQDSVFGDVDSSFCAFVQKRTVYDEWIFSMRKDKDQRNSYAGKHKHTVYKRPPFFHDSKTITKRSLQRQHIHIFMS